MGLRAKLDSAKVWLAGKGWSIEASSDYGWVCFDVLKLRVILPHDVGYSGVEFALLGLRLTVLKCARAGA